MEKKYRELFGAFVFITFSLFGWHFLAVDVFDDYVRGKNDVGIVSVGMSFFCVLGFALLVFSFPRKC